MNKINYSKTKISIAAVGDICLADHILCTGFGVRTNIEKHGYDFLFRNVKKYFTNNDINFGNLECVLSDVGLKKDDYYSKLFRGKPEYVKILKNAGFNVINIANNHTMQHGPEAFNDTINILKKNSIHPLGTKGTFGYSTEPVIIQKGNIKCAMLGYYFGRDQFCADPLYALGNLSKIKIDIKKVKKKSDLVILSCHWGLELMNRPSPNTIKIARDFIDAGADIILGHHSHTVQGVENYKNKLIFYSLGNFIFDLLWDKYLRNTGIFKIDINNKLFNYCIFRCFVNDSCQPQPIGPLVGNLSKYQIIEDPNENIEYNNFEYYKEFNKRENKNQINKVLFVLKNINKIPIKVLFLLFKRKLKNR